MFDNELKKVSVQQMQEVIAKAVNDLAKTNYVCRIETLDLTQAHETKMTLTLSLDFSDALSAHAKLPF